MKLRKSDSLGMMINPLGHVEFKVPIELTWHKQKARDVGP